MIPVGQSRSVVGGKKQTKRGFLTVHSSPGSEQG